MNTGGPVVGTRRLNRALLQRQLLTERSAMPAARAVAHLVGMQSQAPSPPYTGLWTRLDGFEAAQLSGLIERREVVRIALMRSTLHLVTEADCRALRPLLADMLARVVRSQFGKQLTGVDLEELARLGREAAEDRPLTFAELGTLLTEHWPGKDAGALAQTVRNLVPLVQVPPRGLWGRSGPAAHTTADHWLRQGPDEHASLDAYVLRYLAAYGPASVRDMQKWSGLSRLGAVFTRLGERLRRYRDEHGTVLHDLAGTALPDADMDVPVRFLPEFDNILLSHAERERILPPEYRREVFTVNGIIRPTILVDGFVAGRWRIDRGKGPAVLTVEPFAPLSRHRIAELTEEGERLVRFAAPDARSHGVRIMS